MEKRVQGRPSRAAGVVGRSKIIADIRLALRANPTMEATRKNLAHAIGVTPALITYYFPEKTNLNEALCVPIVEAHRISLLQIINRTDRVDTKLKEIVSVLHELYGRDRRMYEMYQEFEELHPDDYAETATMTQILSDFFGGADSAALPLSFAAFVLQGAVRRMCEFAEQIEREAAAPAEPEAATPTPAWLESLCSLFSGPSMMTGQMLAA